MKTWIRATRNHLCGGCGEEIRTGAPELEVLITYLNGPRIRKVRCQACAGEAPPDLPALIERAPAAMTPMTRVGLTPFDFKQRATGER